MAASAPDCMYTQEDKASLSCVMNGPLAGIVLNSKAADFVVTGCGTVSVLQAVDPELLKATIAGEKFQSLFFPNCQDDAMASYLQGVIKG